MKEYLQDLSQVLTDQGSGEAGLSQWEADARLGKYGVNKLDEGKKKTLLQRFLAQLADPMIIILIIAAVISGITSYYSNEPFTDVIIILSVVIINAILGVVQESKAEQAIEALQEMTAATSKVYRDGNIVVKHSSELVPGDVIVLEAGDAVPADCRVIESASLKCEEASLTGESVPVDKISDRLTAADNGDVALGDRKNMVYMGSTVVYGRGRAVVTSTGMSTEMGKIAGAIAQAEDGDTPLQKKLTQLSKILSLVVLLICVFIFGVNVLRALPDVSRSDLMEFFMVAVSLAVAAIPEGLAAVVTIVLSMGVTKMSKRNAVIRRLTAVETLGCAQVICSDKTGTLTQNRMTVVDHRGDENELATAMALCCDAYPDPENAQEAVGEPTEAALVNYATGLGLMKDALSQKLPRIGEIPFDSGRKMMTTLHSDGDRVIQYTKGAPDVVLSRCSSALIDGKETPMTDKLRKKIADDNKAMADEALRVLCAARRIHDSMPGDISSDNLEKDLCYIGLTGMIDPIRPEVKPAIEQCHSAGIRPIMITGDHKDTAVAIAKQLGIIKSADEAISGAQLNEISDEQFESDIEKYSVYARVQPEHKVRIVNGWRKKGMVTAMTGDGVNDAPSIKAADIGIGMGITGTDVTKNTADMVLADDNFATIVTAVEEGRRIYDNIRKSIQFLPSSNLSEVLSIFISALLGFTLLKPAHLLWVNLITDCFPALALGTEPAEADIMRRKPRSSDDGIFADGMGTDVLIHGIFVTVITLAGFFIGHYMDPAVGRFEIPRLGDSAHGMTMAFLALSMAEIFHSFNMRSRHASIFSIKTQNKYLWASMALSVILTLAVIFIPFLARAFGFADNFTFAEYLVGTLLALAIIPLVEILKLIRNLADKNKGSSR